VELKNLRSNAIINSFFLFLFVSAPSLVTLATFGTFAIGHDLTVEKVRKAREREGRRERREKIRREREKSGDFRDVCDWPRSYCGEGKEGKRERDRERREKRGREEKEKRREKRRRD
jgi:hypothetical protein